MDITLTDSLVLLAVLAILLIGYGNRRAVTAQASRSFVKDHLKGVHHQKLDKTMLVLKKRLSLLSAMLTLGALGTTFAFITAMLASFKMDSAEITFTIALSLGALSALLAARESSIGNRSHFAELDATVSARDPYHNTAA